MAMSAHLRSASALSPSFGNVATPMLAVIKVSRPPRSNGAVNASRNFCATSAASSGRARSAITTANSSPPPRRQVAVPQALAPQLALGAPGHRIDLRQLLEPLLGRLAHGDVAAHAAVAAKAPGLVVHRLAPARGWHRRA